MIGADKLLRELPPFLDGYEAICQAIAQDDIDHAWYLARQYQKTAKPIRAEALALMMQRQQFREYSGEGNHE